MKCLKVELVRNMPKITNIWAFIATDKNGEDEGVVAKLFTDPLGSDAWMPLVGADEARVNSLKPLAQEIARLTRKNIVLVKFSVRKDVETITP
jgi:hypothetical protein